MLLAEEDKSLEVIPTAAQEVFDVSGAGDTVIAALAMCLSAGTPFIESARFANLAAELLSEKWGLQPFLHKKFFPWQRDE